MTKLTESRPVDVRATEYLPSVLSIVLRSLMSVYLKLCASYKARRTNGIESHQHKHPSALAWESKGTRGLGHAQSNYIPVK
jgi:hypothetical protein